MTKQEFLKTLREELEHNKVQNVQDILSDYEEHFHHGLGKGKTEVEISTALGNPTTLAKAYKTESLISEIKNPENEFRWGLAFHAIGRFLLIAPFNFFVLSIPGAVVLSLVVAGWSVSVAFGSVGLAAFSVIPALGALSTSAWAGLAGVFAGLGLLGLAAISGMVMFVASKYLVLAAVSYVQWNLKFILQK